MYSITPARRQKNVEVKVKRNTNNQFEEYQIETQKNINSLHNIITEKDQIIKNLQSSINNSKNAISSEEIVNILQQEIMECKLDKADLRTDKINLNNQINTLNTKIIELVSSLQELKNSVCKEGIDVFTQTDISIFDNPQDVIIIGDNL